MKTVFVILFTITTQALVFSQNPSEDFIGTWYTYASNHRFIERISISPYVQFRFYEPSSNYNLAYLSMSVNYHMKGNHTLGLGYAYLDIDTVFEFDYIPNVIENRTFEQYVYKHNFGKLKMQHRARFEQRFLKISNTHVMENRFRYRISFEYSINKLVFLSLSEEPFINFQDQVFHENRFYSGIGFNILTHTQVQIGYVKQHIRKFNLNRIQVAFSLQTDSRKSKTSLVQQ